MTFPFQGRQINEDDYKKKCGPGPTGDVCLAITGIARVTSSCANGTSPVGGRCSLECEQEGAELGVGNEMYGNLVCQKKGGGVSCFRGPSFQDSELPPLLPERAHAKFTII